jgi:hypothetical protein
MTSRKDAIKEYKARAPNRGVFAIRCLASGGAWVGASLNLDASRNRAWSGGDQMGRTRADAAINGDRATDAVGANRYFRRYTTVV